MNTGGGRAYACRCRECVAARMTTAVRERAAELDRILDEIALAADLAEAQNFYAEQVAMMRDRAPA